MDSVEFAEKCQKIKKTLRNHSLAQALFQLEVLSSQEPSLFAKDDDELKDIRANYNRMLEYSSLGVSDDKAQMYFSKYLEDTYAIVQNVILQQLISQNSVFKASYKRALQIGSCDIQTQLADLSEKEAKAYAKLNEEGHTIPDCHVEEENLKEMADFRSKLFAYILVSPQWTSTEKADMVNLITSSLTDEMSAQMMISAIMLACMAVFDFQKFLTLLDIYKKTANVKVKEKALIAIGLCSVTDDFYKNQMTEVLNNECKQDATFFKEWMDLQKQIILCLNTKRLDNYLKSNILRNKDEIHKLYTSLNGLKAESLPNEPLNLRAEQKEHLKQMLQGMEQTLNLEKSGYDTEYDTFSKLKDIPFFRSVVNWFTPFYYGNPQMSLLSANLMGLRLIFDLAKSMTTTTDCGSYAMAYAFMQSATSYVPSDMEKMFMVNYRQDDSKIKKPHTPSDHRLLFLRDIYRFFTLSPLNTFAPNVFDMEEDESAPALFMLQHKLDADIYDKAIKNICRFLYKRKDYGKLHLFLDCVTNRDEEFCMFATTVAVKLNKRVEETLPYAEKLYKNHSDNQEIARLLAQLYALHLDYQKMVDLFLHAGLWKPNNPEVSIALPRALDRLGKHDEAIQKLFELYYNNPNSVSVIDNLWRSLLKAGNVEKAYQMILKLKSLEPVTTNGLFQDDEMVEALYLWEKGKPKEAFDISLKSIKKFRKRNLHAVMLSFQQRFEEYATMVTNFSPFIVKMQSERICQYVYDHLSDFLLEEDSNQD